MSPGFLLSYLVGALLLDGASFSSLLECIYPAAPR